MDGLSHTMRMMVIAWAIGICSCAHDPSQVLVLHHSYTSDRHEITPQSKLRVRLSDGREFQGIYHGREGANLRLSRERDGYEYRIRADDVIKLRYSANATRGGAARGVRRGAVGGAVIFGVTVSLMSSVVSNQSGAWLVGLVSGSALGAASGSLWGALLGALWNAADKPPIDLVIGADHWSITGLKLPDRQPLADEPIWFLE